MTTRLEEALAHVKAAGRKGSRAAAWVEADAAAALFRITTPAEPNGRWPDLDQLEKDLRLAAGPDTVILTESRALVIWLMQRGIIGEMVPPSSVTGRSLANALRGKRVVGLHIDVTYDIAAAAAEVVIVDLNMGMIGMETAKWLNWTAVPTDLNRATVTTYQVREGQP